MTDDNQNKIRFSVENNVIFRVIIVGMFSLNLILVGFIANTIIGSVNTANAKIDNLCYRVAAIEYKLTDMYRQC